MKILLCGYDGAMGQVFSKLYKVAYGFSKSEAESSYPITTNLSEFEEKVDVIIDFSHPKLFDEIADYARKTKTPFVVATTGLSERQLAYIDQLALDIPVLQSGNFSRSMIVMTHLVSEASKLLPNFDIEIIEAHHRYKVDAPSGSALMLFEAAKKINPALIMSTERNHKREANEVGMQSLRGGTLSGDHKVQFFGEDESLSLSHHAQSKDIFAHGAYEAALYLVKQEKGRYDYKDVVFND
ncbi:MAG TPA: 4-hydroxy-tetrahydrodipicolinate reductase [Erysipelothrix sp.]